MKNEDETRSVGQVRIVKTIASYLFVIDAVCEDDMTILEIICCEKWFDILVTLSVECL